MRRWILFSFVSRPRLVGLLRAPIALGSLSCGDTCEDCPKSAHYEYVCGGFIAPYCGTFCITGNSADFTIVSDCCCDGDSGSPEGPADP